MLQYDLTYKNSEKTTALLMDEIKVRSENNAFYLLRLANNAAC
ncbi:hypothetical protein SC1083_0147 [Aggregatibacter actinomycetemcomitans serotype e str. SC1083]|uniref:Uncharacterized protein n=1 Tax=Aggregatibacter actinomycetemcomitans serotype e str. SC1083 TaxID=907488 RepID=G4A5R2_AGGAC|nr:hypothetical protein SC1083_0147 [Aggregatibacter actinomycetemcomitans serotype e str. SC1083]